MQITQLPSGNTRRAIENVNHTIPYRGITTVIALLKKNYELQVDKKSELGVGK